MNRFRNKHTDFCADPGGSSRGRAPGRAAARCNHTCMGYVFTEGLAEGWSPQVSQ